jgi:ferritin-like metal-binding protein YciE
MAGYKTAIALAQRLKAAEVVALLDQSLSEEQGAEETLRRIAASLMKAAAQGQDRDSGALLNR